MSELPVMISIIIPCYNRVNLLKDTLDSILKQTYKNWECLVIDDGSTDSTAAMVGKFVRHDARIKYHKRTDEYKPGGNGARNFGLDLAIGEFINWFDSDDIMLPTFLQDKIENIKPEHSFIISSHQIVNENLRVLRTVELEIKDYIFKDYVLWRQNFCIVTANVLFRKHFLTKNNFRFDENIQRGQEAEFFARIFVDVKSEEYVIINSIGYLYRQHDDSKTKLNEIYNEEYIKNFTTIFSSNLKQSLRLGDKDLSGFICERLCTNLFFSKKKSKSNYYYILSELNIHFINHKKWKLLYFFLIPYYYTLSSPRVEEYIKKEIHLLL